MTGRGLERAEELANNVAADLYDLIEDADQRPTAVSNVETLRPDGEVVAIERLSQAFKELDEEMSSVIRDLKGNII
ncbi:hypothetical protein [Rhizobium sp. BK060]|uniref:hypothetical protein n=1 Tax=Rhizobium sp. BK060 TaxID=2587096 RepID=UPI001611B3AE|nr:hypothetical protein [Rhizobium sp. BK060]MBB3398828.1 uncharacterized protein (UPF0335 family) [Rhizobium sp. BK060]